MATEKQLYWVEKLVSDPRLTPAVKAQARHILANPTESPGDLLGIMFVLCPKEPKAAKKGPSWTQQPGMGHATGVIHDIKASASDVVTFVKAPAQDATKVYGAEYPGIVPGYYAVPNPNGTNDLTFFCVRFGSQFSKAPAMQDRVFVKRVVGGHAAMPCMAPEARKYLALVTDANASRALYGQEIGSCGNCNKHLTDQVSRDRGYGPDCWSNL
jgi:hypothetical protein